MAVIGEKKQEEKLKELAKIAKDLFPDVNELAVKGAFRHAAKAAIEKSGFTSWGEVAEKPPSVRKKFFETLLQEAKPHLAVQLSKENVDEFIKKAKMVNEKYVKG